jgi:putative DNA methylase
MTITRKKLIEVALPLDAINAACRPETENPFLKGHPRSLHNWWARLPLVVARAVLFASLVDDPDQPGIDPDYAAALDQLERPATLPNAWDDLSRGEQRRAKLQGFLGQLATWEATNNERLTEQARRLIHLSCGGRVPAAYDPFAGRGSIPLEAQRLGLEAQASDLNPIAVLICKAMIEIPPKFAGQPPVNPESRKGRGSTAATWKGAAGLAEDVRYYGKWMRDETEKRIGHLYPKVKVTPEMVAERPDLKPYVGWELTVIAWIWARTVKSPNPAFANVDVPLASTFMLSAKPGKEAYVEPLIENGGYRFTVKVGMPKDADRAKTGTKLARGANFKCLMSNGPIGSEHIHSEALAGRMGARLMAIVAEGERGRVYLAPTPEMEAIALTAQPAWKPDLAMPKNPRWFSPPLYGLTSYGDLFTPRQLVALTTFSDLVGEAREGVERDALTSGLPSDPRGLDGGGSGAQAYADAVAVYLACGNSRLADYHSSICTWNPTNENVRNVFVRQAIPMTWDFAEANPVRGQLDVAVGANWAAEALRAVPTIATSSGRAWQASAATPTDGTGDILVSTDPPYYDNISYADLSDFFYAWDRRSLQGVLPSLFATLASPKEEELVANISRHGSSKSAYDHFVRGFLAAFENIRLIASPHYPLTVVYAFKEEEGNDDSRATGWEAMLSTLLASGFCVTGSWPMRTSKKARAVARDTNALASAIILVCRPRNAAAPAATRAEFLQELAEEMRKALPVLTSGEVAPVDLAQASIGPGMAVYSKYSQVVRQDGKPVTVREALQDINNAISAYRTERTSSFDPKTRFCLDFYDQFGFGQAEFDNATVLARAQAVGIDTLEREHLLVAEAGKAWLVPLKSCPVGVEGLERRFGGSAWEACMRLAATLQEEGESATAGLARELGDGVCARARELAVWLYTIADARKRSQDALAFNALDASWPEIQRLMAAMDRSGQQGRFA